MDHPNTLLKNSREAATTSNPKEYYAGTRQELRPFIPTEHNRVLEVGCGNGGFRKNLSSNAEVWGIEPVLETSKLSERVLDRVIVGTFDDAAESLPDHFFDLVICNDVIEHMANDAAFLRDIQQKMTVDGVLMGSIPNMRYWPVLKALLLRKEWEYQNEGVLDRTHLRFYTIESFPKLLKSCGYEVLKFEGINRLASPKNWLVRRFFRLPLFNDCRHMQFAFTARKTL